MAIWQWDLTLVPRYEVTQLFSSIPQYMDFDWFETIEWWKSISSDKMTGFFDGILPTYFTPWAKDTLSWGSDDGNRIQMSVELGNVKHLFIRIDLRSLNLSLLEFLTDFSSENGFLFFAFDTQKFIEPDLELVIDAIKNSRKMGFVNNPEKFFEDKRYLDDINKKNLLKKVDGSE
jgi:hypothetical protein